MSNSPYTREHAEQDIFRAMRLVKSRAKEFDIDTAKVGVMGFSAGGEAAAWVSYQFKQSHAASHDAIDQLSAKPAFQILIYPGPSAVPDTLEHDAPPTFLLAANEDPIGSPVAVKLLEMHRKAKAPVEMHLYEKGEHGFHLAGDSPFTENKPNY
jgi:acetyl esterase/lipase